MSPTLVMQRVFGLALGYEHLNGHNDLRRNPMMTLKGRQAYGDTFECAPVAGKSTLKRLELSRPVATRCPWLGLSPDGDDFPSRTAGSVYAMAQMDLAAVFGYDAQHAYQVMDSGISYLLYSQSVLGTAAIWLVIACGLPQKDRPSTVFSHATAIYVALNLLISYSVFSVKTAGLLWFLFGAMGLGIEASAKTSDEAATLGHRPFRDDLREGVMS